jgi:hypothetical protein
MMLKEAFHRFFQKGRVWKILFLTVGLLLVAVRFFWLNEFPPGISHDEHEVVLSARSFWQKGVDISGVGFPKLFFATKGAGLAGFPSVFLSPIYGILKLSLSGVRLPYVFLNLVTIFTVSYLAYVLTKRKSVFGISLLVGLTSPWLFFYSRRVDESPVALVFTILGIVVFLKTRSDRKTFYSIPPFIISFFSYQGAKVVVPILVVLLVLVSNLKPKVKALFLALFLALPVVFFLYSYLSPDSTFHRRQSEMIFSKLNEYSLIVDEQRRDSIVFPFSNLYYNKYTYVLAQMFKNYIGFISPSFLFFKGDGVFSFGEHGLMLPVDIIFVLIGIAALVKLKDGGRVRAWQLVILLFATATVGSAIEAGDAQYIFRGFLLIPAFVILVSLGISFVRERVSFKDLYDILIVLLYFFFFLVFLFFFFFRYSITESENQFLSERILASYLHRAQQIAGLGKIVVVVPSPDAVRSEYDFFTGGLGTVDASTDCRLIESSATFIISSKMACPAEQGLKPVVIQNPEDTGAIFKIYNDKLCLGAELTSYRRYHLVSDYAVEQMDNATFCNRWIGRYE